MSDRWVDNNGKLGQTILECSVGDIVKICHSKNFRGIEASELKRGFRLSNPELGELTETGVNEWNCVYYRHNYPGKQVVEFIEAQARRRSYIEISGSIRLHDHASIPQGGPAYATYYSELDEDEEGGGT